MASVRAVNRSLPASSSRLTICFVGDYDPDPLQSLALTVRDLFESGEHWQAAVAVSLLGDVKIARLLRAWFEVRGDAAPTLRFLDEAGRPRPPANLLRTYLPEVGDASLSSVHARWEESTRAFWDGLARRELGAIGEKEAGDAIVAVWGLLDELERVVGAARDKPGELQ